MPKEKLNGPEIFGPSVNQGGLCAPQRMGPKQPRGQSGAPDLLRNKSSILAGRHTGLWPTTTREQELAGSFVAGLQIIIDGLAGLLAQFESDGPTSFLLSNGCAIRRVAAGGDILDPYGDDVAAAKLAVDRQIEHREVANSAFDLELRPDRPDMFRSQRRLASCQLAFVLGHALVRRRGDNHFILHSHSPRLQTPRSMGPPIKALESGQLSDHFGLGPRRRQMRPVAFDPKRTDPRDYSFSPLSRSTSPKRRAAL